MMRLKFRIIFLLPAFILSGCFLQLYAKVDAGPYNYKKSDTLWINGRLLPLDGKGWSQTELFYDRLPLRAKGLVREPVWNLARHSAGQCLRFQSNADTIYIRWELTSGNLSMPHMPSTGVSGIDLYKRDLDGNWQFLGNGRPSGVMNKAVFHNPGESGTMSDFLLYLPLYNGIRDITLGVKAGYELAGTIRRDSSQKPVVFYGTSITQGGCASRPGLAYTAILGRQLDIPIINLGFSGNGQMEKEMAELISELDASVFLIDCMRNMSLQLVEERSREFIRILRLKHPKTPLVLIEESDIKPVYPSERGKALYKIYSEFRAKGDMNIYFFPGNELLGSDSEGTVDGIHPNDLGFFRHAAVLQNLLAPLLKKRLQEK